MKTLAHRATVYLEPSLHRALKVKAVQTDFSVSELINDAIKESLREDQEDLEAFKKRNHEPVIPFEEVLKDLKRRGKI